MDEIGSPEMEIAIDYVANYLSGVNSIDVEFCKQCAQSEYSRFEQMVESFSCDLYGDDEVQEHLIKAAEKIRLFYIKSEDTNRFFEGLLNRGVEVLKLANFLWFCVDSALQPTKTKEDVRLALSGANLYVAMSSIKSAKLYKFYDVNIYQKCLELFKQTEKLLRPLVSKVAAVLNPKKRNANAEANDPLELGEGAGFLKTKLCYAMRSLFVSFNSNIVDAVLENEDRCRTVADFLRDVTYMDVDHSTEPTRRSIQEVEYMNKTSQLTFAILHSILDRRSELRTHTIASRVVMPYLLFWVCGNGKQAITGNLPNVLRDTRDWTVRFIGERIVYMNKFELDCYMRILKSLPLKCFDRAEYRSHVSHTFVEILRGFPSMAYYLLDDVYVLGRHNKTVHRSFAYELVNRLLQSFPFNQIPDPPVPLNDLVADDTMGGIEMEDIEHAEELDDASAAEQTEVEPMDEEPAGEENVEATEGGETANETAGTTGHAETEEAEVAEVTNRPHAITRAPAEPRNPNQMEFARHGMTPKQAMLMLIISGLVDKHAKQKALQAIEDLFAKNTCVKDLCLLAKKFVDENHFQLNLPGRPAPEEVAEVEDSPAVASGSRPQSRTLAPVDGHEEVLQPMEQDEPEDHALNESVHEHTRLDMLGLMITESDDLIRLIMRAFEDDKTLVVKHALSACVAVLLQGGTKVRSRELFQRSVEEITVMRKQAAVCLKDLLNNPKDVNRPVVEKAWLEGLLHQVVDNEVSVSQQAVKFVVEYVVKGLSESDSNAWNLMKRVEESSEYTRYLAICLTEHTNSASTGAAAKSMGNVQGMIRDLLKSLERMTLSENCPAAAWMLLCELSYGAKKLNLDCVEKVWERLDLNNSDDRIPTYVAKVLANCCDGLRTEKRVDLKTKIKQQLMHTRIATAHISAVCYALACLTEGILPNGGKGNKEGIAEIEKFSRRFNEKVKEMLDHVVIRPLHSRIASRNTCTPALQSQQPQTKHDPQTMIRAIYTVGELTQYVPKIDSLIFNSMRAGVVSDKIEEDYQMTQNRLNLQQQPRFSENGMQNTEMDEDSPALPPGAIILPDSQAPSSSQGTNVPPVQIGLNGQHLIHRGVLSAMFLSLGKMSIVDENIAGAITPRLAKQMREDSDHCVRNNLLVVMADIFRINTTAVNDYGPGMASCLRDPSVLIRKQAVFLITSLIRDEYFKWDGQIMYFYLGALLDHELEVREQVRASLMNVLLPKSPKMLINRFVEIMFYFNDVTHPNMTVSMQHEKENCPLPQDDRFALYGERRANERMEIYKFMISTFSDVENLPLMCRIALEVFENIAEERLKLVVDEGVYDRNMVCLLKDALSIIKSKEIVLTLQTGRKAGGAEELEEETEEANHMQAVAGDVIAHTFLKTINQEVLNRMFRLKDYLKKIPDFVELAKNTHSNILDIYEHYFEHFDKLIGNDSQRRGEVKNDLERLRKRTFPRQQAAA